MNGNLNSYSTAPSIPYSEPYDRCVGRVYTGGLKHIISTDDLYGLAGPDGAYYRWDVIPNQGTPKSKLKFGKGILPSCTDGGIGGLMTDYTQDHRITMVGRWPGHENRNEGVIFSITTMGATSKPPATLVTALVNSGILPLQGGIVGEHELLIHDGGNSVALSHVNPDNSLTVQRRSARHGEVFGGVHIPFPQWINNYVMFFSAPPR